MLPPCSPLPLVSGSESSWWGWVVTDTQILWPICPSFILQQSGIIPSEAQSPQGRVCVCVCVCVHAARGSSQPLRPLVLSLSSSPVLWSKRPGSPLMDISAVNLSTPTTGAVGPESQHRSHSFGEFLGLALTPSQQAPGDLLFWLGMGNLGSREREWCSCPARLPGIKIAYQ